MERKPLAHDAAIEAACILFSLNTQPEKVVHMAEQAGFGNEESLPLDIQVFCHEWYGFVHAAVVASLMVHTPNSVLVGYLRSTTKLMQTRHMSKEDVKPFIDTCFAPYMELLGKEEQQQCPGHFFQKVCCIEKLEHIPPRALALISATMAMTISACADTWEKYDIAPV